MRQSRTTEARMGKRAVAMAEKDSRIQNLLDQLAKALTAGDGRTAATFWRTPAFVIGDEHERVVASQQEVEQFFSGSKEQYNQRGITDTRADIQRLDWITDRIALVEVRWPYLDAKGNEVGEETSTYLFKRDEGGELKLRLAIMHGAAETPKTH